MKRIEEKRDDSNQINKINCKTNNKKNLFSLIFSKIKNNEINFLLLVYEIIYIFFNLNIFTIYFFI